MFKNLKLVCLELFLNDQNPCIVSHYNMYCTGAYNETLRACVDIECSAGTYVDYTTLTCIDCAMGTYRYLSSFLIIVKNS